MFSRTAKLVARRTRLLMGAQRRKPRAFGAAHADGEALLASLRAEAATGDPAALYRLGKEHESGLRVSWDEAEALRLITLSAKAGYAPAQADLGVLLCRENTEAAAANGLAKLEKAARQGHTLALHNLAVHSLRMAEHSGRKNEALAWGRLCLERRAALVSEKFSEGLARLERTLDDREKAAAEALLATLRAELPA